MRSGETRSSDGRVARILALGLVWGIGVVALVVQRVDRTPPRRAVPAVAATPVAATPSLDCLLQAPTASIDIVGGMLGCDEAHEERFRLTWADDRETTLAVPDRQLSISIERDARRSFVASLAEAAHRPIPAGDGCTALRFVDLTWRCGAGAPLHARFSEGNCDLQRGPVGLVSEALTNVAFESGPAEPQAPAQTR